MAKRKYTKRKNKDDSFGDAFGEITDETKRGIWGVLLLAFAILFALAGFGYAGVAGNYVFAGLSTLFGIGYALVPISLALWGIAFFRSSEQRVGALKAIGTGIFFIASLGLVNIAFSGQGGIVGSLISKPLIASIAAPATVVILIALIVVTLLIIFNAELKFELPAFMRKREVEDEEDSEESYEEEYDDEDEDEEYEDEEEDVEEEEKKKSIFTFGTPTEAPAEFSIKAMNIGEYTPPPLSILSKNRGKPQVGDIKASVNVIKRTLENFGINVEMDEVSIGPTVTRFALKPAEGVRLAKILSLQNNLELALAASPVRIEAPIPGKALVGIEVPNQARTTLGLGSLLGSSAFVQSDKPLLVTLGTDISGAPHYINLAKMPHILIAGATGAGKSVTIHDFIVSLLYRRGPDQLRFIMIDPKRVELTLYNKIPHLLTPVITDPKKAIIALKWLAKEMDRRYDILESEAVRDISSYHDNVLGPARKNTTGAEEDLPEQMPYIVVVLDELSDLMQSYPRELEAAIVRLAQMSRAVGIHLMLSTQRPSVQVITGLIKANIPARLALQVSSQIDSRTILDTGGAEKLLGAGDMLFLSGEMSKPQRIQAPYITEDEVKKVVAYLKKAYQNELPDEIELTTAQHDDTIFAAGVLDGEDPDDDLYEDAKQVVTEAGKASTSYIQRKLRVGYARAARLMDILEEKGVVGPADGSKPREILGREQPAGSNTPEDTADEANDDYEETARHER